MQNTFAVILLTVLLLMSDFFNIKKGKACFVWRLIHIDCMTLCTKVIFWQRWDHEKVRFAVPFGKEAVWYRPANIISPRLFHLSVHTVHCLPHCFTTGVWLLAYCRFKTKTFGVWIKDELKITDWRQHLCTLSKNKDTESVFSCSDVIQARKSWRDLWRLRGNLQ